MQWETEKEIQKARNRVEARKVSRFNNSCSEPMAPVLLPGESMDRGAWQATVHGVARVGHDLVTKPPPSQV